MIMYEYLRKPAKLHVDVNGHMPMSICMSTCGLYNESSDIPAKKSGHAVIECLNPRQILGGLTIKPFTFR